MFRAMSLAQFLLVLANLCICTTTASVASTAHAVTEDAPAPLIPTESPKIRSRPRALGIGWSLGGGFDLGDRPFSELGSMTLDGGVEARVFPIDRFSIDVQFDVAESLIESGLIPDRNAYHFRLFFHIHETHKEGAYFAAAPYVGLRTYVAVGDTRAAFDIGSRVGAEFPARGGTFAMGVYGRPGFQVFENYQGLTRMSLEVVFELTWTIYLLGPEPVEG